MYIYYECPHCHVPKLVDTNIVKKRDITKECDMYLGKEYRSLEYCPASGNKIYSNVRIVQKILMEFDNKKFRYIPVDYLIPVEGDSNGTAS